MTKKLLHRMASDAFLVLFPFIACYLLIGPNMPSAWLVWEVLSFAIAVYMLFLTGRLGRSADLMQEKGGE